ncbi:MAG: alpha-N-arabinofuranosidase [Anaerolineae bacterium]
MSDARFTVCLDEILGEINPNLYGHFVEHLGACVYEGIWVGEDSAIPNDGGIRLDVVQALRRIAPPVVRWPGGCFADDYHWEDGIGPREARPTRVNIWWDSLESNAFGTHEFMHFCRLIGAQPYLCGNVGSGSPRELRNWIEYCNYAGPTTLAKQRAANGSPEPFQVRYWGVGNENWGCGGNMEPDEYATLYRRYATFLRSLGPEPFLIACGPNGNSLDWTRRFFASLGSYRQVHGYAAHYYCGTAGTDTEYTVEEWYTLLRRAAGVETLILQQRALMDDFDPERRIGLIIDEWGAWHPPLPGRNPHHLWQQNTMRDALVAALTLDTFNRHADKVIMGNIAQMMNVLQAMVLTEGSRMLTTPTYHVYAMYRAHQGGQSVRLDAEAGAAPGSVQQALGAGGSASRKGDTLTLSLVNPLHADALETEVVLRGGSCRSATLTTLAHGDIHAHNTFDEPGIVQPAESAVAVAGESLRMVLPAASVSVLTVQLGS